ncbi:MAG: hypothetical protein H0U86_13925 [Chloroflexi bacterium]|nr:hypothetical protein [Chloroflexota bacterium]
MELEQLVPGIIGAFVGVIGWLFVGVYIQRRQFMSQARNAARAVYFEVDVNRVAVTVARDFGSFTPLDRTSFERLLPELATLLKPAELQRIVSAYMSHAGYQQASSGADELPSEVRRRMLDSILAAHEQALETLRTRAFSAREARALGVAPITASAPAAPEAERTRAS